MIRFHERSITVVCLAGRVDQQGLGLPADNDSRVRASTWVSPGTNQVRSANPDDQAAARALAERDLASADLVTLYDNIGDIAWADVGNGYFVDPVPDVLLRLKEYGAVGDGTGDEARGLVIEPFPTSR